MIISKNTRIYIFCLLFLLCTEIKAEKDKIDCKNNATIEKSSNTCICKSGYIGNQCQTAAYPLSKQPTQIDLSQKYQFAYFEPESASFQMLLITICLPKDSKHKSAQLQIFQQQETFEGNFIKEPLSKSDIYPIKLPYDSSDCVTLQSINTISLRLKLNGEKPKIIFGIRSQKNKSIPVLVSCEEKQVLSLNLIRDIGIISVVFMALAICFSAIFNIRKKIIERRQAQQNQKKFKELLKNVMPTKKFSQYLQENNISDFKQNCTICLNEFQPSETIRETPCRHLFHKDCIESWCKKQISCPVCRFDMAEGNRDNQNTNEMNNGSINQQGVHEEVEIEMGEEIGQNFEEDNEQNIRERML